MEEIQMTIDDLLPKSDMELALEEAAKGGPGFEDGKIRIFAMMENITNRTVRMEFIRDEYGTGGHSLKNGFVDYSGAGVRIWGRRDKSPDYWFMWSSLYKCISKLILLGEYLDEEEQATVDRIREEHGGKLPMPEPRLQYPLGD